MTIFTALVRIDTDTLEHAQQVLNERTGYDEWLGFDYWITAGGVTPTDDALYGMNPYYEDWRYEAANGDTRLGLHEWIAKRREQEAEGPT